MKMKEVIDRVSELYREERGKEYDLRQELNPVLKALADAEHTRGENITVAEYKHLIEQKKYLENKIALQIQYYEGMSTIRELLMDLGFDTEVK